MFIPRKVLEEKLRQMLAEDIGYGDVTSTAVISAGLEVEAAVVTKEAGIAAGIEEIVVLAESLGLSIKTEVMDGEEFSKRQILVKISGDARTILSAERTILNLLSHMSGIATATRKLIEKLRNVGATAKIAATRKTSPGLSYFDKKAVLVGGGDPHRLRLDDMILLKENHLVIAGGVKNAVKNPSPVLRHGQDRSIRPRAQGVPGAPVPASDVVGAHPASAGEVAPGVKVPGPVRRDAPGVRKLPARIPPAPPLAHPCPLRGKTLHAVIVGIGYVNVPIRPHGEAARHLELTLPVACQPILTVRHTDLKLPGAGVHTPSPHPFERAVPVELLHAVVLCVHHIDVPRLVHGETTGPVKIRLLGAPVPPLVE